MDQTNSYIKDIFVQAFFIFISLLIIIKEMERRKKIMEQNILKIFYEELIMEGSTLFLHYFITIIYYFYSVLHIIIFMTLQFKNN